MSEVALTGQPILILKEGTGRTRGREAQHANIMAARVISEAVKSSLGPKGMDKMLVDSLGDVTITNDGATILDEMDVQHPAAKMMVEVAKAQDKEAGDGTTTAVVLTGELLTYAERLLEKDIHPTVIIDGYKKAAEYALKVLDQIAESVDPLNRDVLKKVVETAIASKMIAENRELIGDIAVEAILHVAQKKDSEYKVDIDDVKVEKRVGESLSDTKLIKGIVLDKEVVHAGMPKRIEKAKIALINCPLEIEKTEFDAKINIESPEQMKAFLDEEAKMLKEMVDKIANAGANVVICQKGIDDMAQHFLARKGILAVRRVKASDMEKLAKATGARILTNLDEISPNDLGYAELVEERKIGDDKWTFIEGCKDARSISILIRGGSDRIVDEAERSIHDALCVVRDVIQEPKIVYGGGSAEAIIAMELRKYANTLTGREQLAVQAFADAIESIPMILAENAGLDPIDIVSEIKSRIEKGEKWVGVDVIEGKVRKMDEAGVVEPLTVKKQIIKSASEAAAMILKIDDIIAASRLKEEGKGKTEEVPETESESSIE